MRRVLPWIIITTLFMISFNVSASPTLPEGLLTLPKDAEILDVRENPASGGLEIALVSDLKLDELHALYLEALQEAEELDSTAIPGGYMISATLDGIHHTIMLSEDAMDANLVYRGKTSVYAILTGLQGRTAQEPIEQGVQGLPWPTQDLPGLPELKGQIHKAFKEGGSVYLEITVKSSDVIQSYIEDLKQAGFSFDSEPQLIDGHLEFFGFLGDSMLGFGYGDDDHFVALEFTP